MAVYSNNGLTVTYEEAEIYITVTRLDVDFVGVLSVFEYVLENPYFYLGYSSSETRANITLNSQKTGEHEYHIWGTWTGNMRYRPTMTTVTLYLAYEGGIGAREMSIFVPVTLRWAPFTVTTNTSEEAPLLVDGKNKLVVDISIGEKAATTGYTFYISFLYANDKDGNHVYTFDRQPEDESKHKEIEIPEDLLALGIVGGTGGVWAKYDGELITSRSFTWYAFPAPGVSDIENVSFEVTPRSLVVPAEWNGYVQGKSYVHAESNATVKYMDLTFAVTAGLQSGQGKSIDFGIIALSGQLQCSLVITDYWGRTATRGATITVWPYAAPVIESIQTVRCDESGSPEELGTSYKAGAVTKHSDCGGHNVPTLTLLQKLSTETEYKPVGQIPIGGELLVQNGAPSTENSYDVCFVFADAFNTVRYYSTIPSGSYFMYFKRGGKGVAVGKAAEVDNLFDVGYDLRVRGDTVMDGELTFNRPDGSSVSLTEILKKIGL